jgi:Flp pilus assembly pilin Flp
MLRLLRKGQSTLEYVIILAAVIGAIITVASVFKPKLERTYSTLGNTMQTTVNKVTY